MKQEVLDLDHDGPSPRYKENGDWSSIYSPKNWGGYIFSKKVKGW